MGRSSYRALDLVFGQLMLQVRMAIGLTQAGLAEYLGVSRRAVGGWEAGQSYPKAEHLKHFISLALTQRAFTAGSEAEAIRELWRAAHQKVLLNEQWLATLLSTQPATTQPALAEAPDTSRTPSKPATRIGPLLDWSDALDAPSLFGREEELALLAHWIVDERCRVVCLVGMGGIGKSALAVTVMRQATAAFDVVIWRSLSAAIPCEALLDSCLQVLDPQSLLTLPDSIEARLQLLMWQLRHRRVLLVFDNWEVLIEEGSGTGHPRAGFDSYARLLHQLGTSAHESCLLLTSREKPADLVPLEGNRWPVRVLKVAGLPVAAGAQLLAEKDLASSQQDQENLIALYGGNPLALKIVAQTIVDLFGADIGLFLAQGNLVFGGVRQLFDEQFNHLSTLEGNIVYWLAIMREPVLLEELLVVLGRPQTSDRILEALDRLNRRSMIERGQRPGSFTLHSVMLEYMMTRIIAQASSELMSGQMRRLISHGLTQAYAKDYLRHAQEQLLVVPVLQQLCQAYPQAGSLEAHLLGLLDRLRGKDALAQGYGPANLLAVLRVLRGNFRQLDLSGLTLRNVSLQGVDMQDSRLVATTLRDSTYTEAFDAVRIVIITADGQRWAVGSRKGEVRIWTEGGRALHLVWQAHLSDMTGLAFSPDGHRLASVSFDNTVKLWDVETGALLWVAIQTGGINTVTFAPDGVLLASAGNDGHIHIWDAYQGAIVKTLAFQHAMISTLAWSPDGRLLASGCGDGSIWLWAPLHTAPDMLVYTFAGHTNWVSGLAFDPSGKHLASASTDGDVKVWDAATGDRIQTVSHHTAPMLRVAWSSDGRTLATCSFDHRIWLWDAREWRVRAVLHGHTGIVYGLTFTPDNLTLLTGSDDGTIRIWDVAHGQALRVIGGYVATLLDVDWGHDGTRLASAGTDTLVTIWHATATTPPLILRGHRWIVQGVAWHPAGQVLASGGYDNRIMLWDTTTGMALQTLRDPDATNTIFFGVAWHPDGTLLAGGTYQRGVYAWDVATATRRWVGQTTSTLVRRLAWSPDGAYLAGSGSEGFTYVWDATDGKLLQQLAAPHGATISVAWHPDSTRLATASGGVAGSELVVWNVDTGTPTQIIADHPQLATAVAWGPGEELLISGSSDGMLRWWNVIGGQCLLARQAHQGTVHALKPSRDGLRLASCGDDGAIVLWDSTTGEQLQTLRRDRPYERMDITGLSGITNAQRSSLIALGAVDRHNDS